jgi:hypothetical protein
MKHEPITRVSTRFLFAYLAALCAAVAYVGVQIVLHGDFMTQWPTATELITSAGIAVALYVAAMVWLCLRRPRD